MFNRRYFRNSAGAFVLILFLFSCKKPVKFSVVGDFSKLDPTPMELYLLQEDNNKLMDSINVKGTHFSLQGTNPHPAFYELKFFNDQTIYLVAHPGEKIKLSIDNSTPEISYYVEGSHDSRRVKKITDDQNIVLKKIDQLSGEWEKNRGDTAVVHKINNVYYSLMKAYRDSTRKFIHNDPTSLANIMALYQNFGRKKHPLFNKYDDIDIFKFVDSSLIALYPETEAVKVLNRDVTDIKEQIKQKRYVDKVVKVGMLFPPYKMIDLKRDTFSSANADNIVQLLYFWSSWNTYSVKELKYIETLQKIYGEKELRIITISLDSDKKKLKEFLTKNHITLPVVCDFKYWDSPWVEKYAVKHIPSTVLSDKKGVIAAKDIFGNELKQRVNEFIPVRK